MSDQQYLVDIQHLQNCTIISAVNTWGRKTWNFCRITFSNSLSALPSCLTPAPICSNLGFSATAVHKITSAS